jgi:hypothetical protein
MGCVQELETKVPTRRLRTRLFTGPGAVQKAVVSQLSAGNPRPLPHNFYRSGGV